MGEPGNGKEQRQQDRECQCFISHFSFLPVMLMKKPGLSVSGQVRRSRPKTVYR
jgi:hypothetical protein